MGGLWGWGDFCGGSQRCASSCVLHQRCFAKNKSSCILQGGGQPKRQRVPFSGKGGHFGILETWG